MALNGDRLDPAYLKRKPNGVVPAQLYVQFPDKMN